MKKIEEIDDDLVTLTKKFHRNDAIFDPHVVHSVRRPKMKFLFFQSYRFLFYPPSAENLKTQKPCYGIPNFDNFFAILREGPIAHIVVQTILKSVGK